MTDETDGVNMLSAAIKRQYSSLFPYIVSLFGSFRQNLWNGILYPANTN